jgi:hypothetical protein
MLTENTALISNARRAYQRWYEIRIGYFQIYLLAYQFTATLFTGMAVYCHFICRYVSLLPLYLPVCQFTATLFVGMSVYCHFICRYVSLLPLYLSVWQFTATLFVGMTVYCHFICRYDSLLPLYLPVWQFTATLFTGMSVYLLVCQVTRSRDRAVGIATGYGLDGQGVGIRVQVGAGLFSSPRRPDQFWDLPSLLSNG